ncbi:hypothetical protein [Hyalangium versicolor]|uniref:hypothetical protein n=1 Tax=Hyalangium versicolor TaxID=2861190 RepID=UPI001CCFC1D5|nr:hypothetical protein [Hyalangium versicolor]
MRLALLSLSLFLALPGFAQERKSKAHVSANGIYSVQLVQEAPGKCRVEMRKESGPAWQFEGCIGTVDDYYFASNDGERFWLLRPLVEKGTKALVEKKGKRKIVRVPAWANATVAELYDRTGQKLQEMRLQNFLKGSRELGEVRQMKAHFKWLEGTLGIPGKGPRLTDDEKVEFEAVGAKTYRLSFSS